MTPHRSPHPGGSSPSRLGRALACAVAVATLGAGAVVGAAAPAGAQDESMRPSALPPEPSGDTARAGSATRAGATTMAFTGRGWGHGRGLSQWGAQGYATNFGWTAGQILDHYYGGTAAGAATAAASRPVDPDAVRIRLIAQDAQPTVVMVASGTLVLSGSGQVSDPGDLTAVRLTKADAGLVVESAPTCAGPWTPVGDGDGQSGRSSITVAVGTGSEQLQLCRTDGAVYWYPGTLTATVVEGVQRTVNTTTVEAQLRSVVPRESPASWSAAALQAQAVAARSYALAGDSRHQPYADTCDTTLCQVYMGHARKLPGAAKEATTDPRTDAAIAATAGVVRLDGSTRIARTEFSSTSGGWTAGGTFPAVEDLGDVISPLHTWSRTVEVDGLEASYGEGGRLVDVEVLERNGLGADGGRVVEARLHFSNGVTAEVSGSTVRSRGGLLSDWFTPTCPVAVRYLDAVYTLFLQRAVTGTEVETWCSPVRQGQRLSLTESLSVSDEWAGVQIGELYRDILGREAESGGRAFWLSQVEAGMLIEEIAAEFYGSEEYYRRAGRTHETFVERLYRDLLGREAEGDGKAFWIRVLDRRQMSRVRVADEFYASIESRSDRVDALYGQILDRRAEPGGRSYWAGQLRELGDVALAAYLAASEEYYQRSISNSSPQS